jgi:hypothetical protein
MVGTNTEYILKRMRADGVRNFSVLDQDKKTVVEEVKDDSLTVDQAIDRVRDTLDFCTGLVFVELCPMSRQDRRTGGAELKKPNCLIPVHCGGSRPAGGNAPMSGIGSTGPSYQDLMAAQEQRFNDRMDALEKDFKHKKEIEDLQRQLAEAKEGNPTVDKIINNLPVIAGFLGFKTPTGIAGPGPGVDTNPEALEFTDQDDEFAETQIKRLLAVDPDFLQVLKRLADMAETNPPMYEMAKNMLPK